MEQTNNTASTKSASSGQNTGNSSQLNKPKHKIWAESPNMPAKKSKPVSILMDEEKQKKSNNSNNNKDHHQPNHNFEKKRQNYHPRGNSNRNYKYPKGSYPYFKRSWKVVSEQSKHLPENTFEVVSYNTLADSLIKKSELYPYCAEWVLEWNVRREKLLDEFKHLNSDIFCLQEIMDFEYFEKGLSALGYKGLYKKRTGENNDGCAIFWKNSKFSLVESQMLEFNQVANGIDWLDRDNIAQIVLLQALGGEIKNLKSEENANETTNSKNKIVCIANTHLLFNPKRGDLKLAQIRLLLNSIDSLFTKYGQIPLIMAGDLNITPDSDIFKFLTTGKLDLYSINYKLASGQLNDFFFSDEWKPIENRIMSLLSKGEKQMTHNLPIQSAYPVGGVNENFVAEAKEVISEENSSIVSEKSISIQYESTFDLSKQMVSSYHARFRGLVDYVFYDTKRIQLLGYFSLPTMLDIEDGKLGKGLPSKSYPSDHFPLKVQFALKTEV